MVNKNYISGLAQEQLDRRRRIDALTAQKIDVAIIFQEMLGTAVAAKYLRTNGVPLSVALRVLIYAHRKDPSPPKMIGFEDGPVNRFQSKQTATRGNQIEKA
ncbi:hypothetical protein [Janthinobacterium sp. RB2P8]|uniref:hypothetical protein n=1 Tax=Janthinobacterium sp. RB2P8 TaxID=3424191 RepID=UPI003F253186